MSLLFIDTETTDFPKKHGNLIQDGQARVCQIAMLLTDDTGKHLAEYSSLIKPDGWTIGKGASDTHGFTDDLCAKYGVSGKGAYVFYTRMVEMADIVVAHNVEFDHKLMEIEAAYCDRTHPLKKWFCTMEASSPICNLPPTQKMLDCGFDKPKNPKLEEALKILCDRELGDTAHDAMYDVKACRDIYFALLDKTA